MSAFIDTTAITETSAGSGVHPIMIAPRSLSRQFLLTGSFVMLLVMLLAGTLLSRIVTHVTVESSANSTALFIDSFLSPHLQALAQSDDLPHDKTALLDRLLGVTSEEKDPFESRFPHLEIWKKGGLVVYSRAREIVGQRFEPPTGLIKALAGEVTANYTDLAAAEHIQRQFVRKYLEIYVPVRDELSGEIIAVAEIHETPDLLQARLFNLRLRSWGMTALLTLVVMASLFGIVHRGSRLIEAQHTALQQRITEIRQISDQNHRLRQKAQLASSRLAELNASYLRNVGAELHDGPAQLVGLAALKVEHVRRAASAVTRGRELQAMDMILADALRDIRTISRGLMLPEIEELPLHEVVARAVRLHEKRTGTKVATICGILDCEVSHAVKICVYRFVQEGLSNAFRHAAADGQSVLCDLTASRLMLAVQDQGGTARQKCTARLEGEGGGLGLTGLRARVESLGGTFVTGLTDQGGTRIEMVLTIMGENG